MNIIIIKDKLKEAVEAVTRAISDHPSLPILKNILIEAKNDLIVLTATNLEIGVKYELSGKIVKEGEITVPAALLGQIISNLSDERVELSAEDMTLQISTESYKATLQGSAAAEFPLLPKIENKEEHIEIETGILRSAIESVLS